MSITYLIEVTRIDTFQETYKDTLLIQETPTDKRKERDYGSGSDPVFDKKWEVVEKVRDRKVETKVFAQTVDEDKFDLGRVVMAVNKFGLP